MLRLRLLAVVCVTLAAAVAHATGEVVTDVRIAENQRTSEDTVRSIAGVDIGDILEADTLDKVRERLNNSGLFSDVNVYWEPFRDGVRINIVIKDKFPWAPVPTFSLSAGNRSFGLVFVHGNLFGRGKQMLAGVKVSTFDSGATLVYRDPSFLGTWLYWQFMGKFQDQLIPEFDPRDDGADQALRETSVRSFGVEPMIGIAWFRKVKMQFGWHIESYDVQGTRFPQTQDPTKTDPQNTLPYTAATAGARVGFAKMGLIFDFRAREYAIVEGNALELGFEWADARWQSQVDYWKASARYEQDIKIGRRVNWTILGAGALGHNLPLWSENWSGGDNLRGYLTRQFRGDSQVRATTELSFPILPTIGSLEVRGLVFFDSAIVWYRDLTAQAPGVDPITGRPVYETRPGKDERNFLPPEFLKAGLDFSRDFHNAVGGGLRFFLRSVSVPLVGIDYGYGLESQKWRLFIVVGA